MRPTNPSSFSIPPGSYYERAIHYIRIHGGEGHVITEHGAPAQWRAWIAYADHVSPKMGRTWRAMQQLTTPTAWPLEFDSDAPPPPMVRHGPA